MHVKTVKTFVIGSSAFFSNIPGFKTKDTDELCLLSYPIFGNQVMNIRKDGKDSFFLYNFGKDKLIQQCINANVPMAAGKFLVPEFANYINLTINDLKKLEHIFNNIDESHVYEKLIYKYYIENNDFKLTDEQLNKVYQIYIKTKNREDI